MRIDERNVPWWRDPEACWLAWMLVFALFIASGSAQATIYKTGLTYSVDGNTGGSMIAACTARLPPAWGGVNVVESVTYPYEGNDLQFGCNLRNTNDQSYAPNFWIGSISGTGSCPSNSTSSGTITCTCNSGYADQGGSCVSQASCAQAAGSSISTGNYPVGGSISAITCVQNCTVKMTVGVCTNDGWCSASGTTSGATCQTNNVPTGSLPPSASACPTGQCPGTVNGIQVCLACGTAVTPVTTTQQTTTTNPDGSGSTTTTTTTQGPGGTTNTSTTTVTNNAQGQPTGTTTSTAGAGPNDGKNPIDDYCARNPTAPICKSATSSFSGSCPSFTCEGDAVQCAIAKEQHKRNCELFTENVPMKQLGEEIIAGNDPQKAAMPWDATQKKSVDMSSYFGSAPAGVWGSSCPTDYSFSMAGGTVTVPFSSWCAPLQMLGVICVAFSFLMGARIALGA